jgi:hypothetical protein
MMPPPSRRTRRTILLAACALALAGCEDAPTASSAHVQSAGGKLWVAVSPPRPLPDARTWLPALGKGEAAGRVEALRDRARRLRSRVELEEAVRTEEEAARLAASSLGRAPSARVVREALGAVDAWTGAAERTLLAAPSPELAQGVLGVRREREAAGRALARGDTLAAVGHLATAAGVARGWSPHAVALRVYARAESRVRRAGLSRPDSLRAERLLRHARQAVLTGDSGRAFRRATYALQLLDAGGR